MDHWKERIEGPLLVLVMVIAAAAAGCAAAGPGGPGTRLAVLDAQRVLNETKRGQAAKEALNEFMKDRQDLLAVEESELKRMEEDLVKQASVLSANARKEREEEFRRRMIRYQQRVAELNREVQDKQRELLSEIRGEIERLAAVVARQQGLLLVLEKGRGGPTVYSDGSIDITDAVIREFEREAR